MSIEHTRALVEAACKIDGVREKLPADWFWPYCPVCGEGCDHSTDPDNDDAPVIICIKCRRDVPAPVLRFEPDTEAGSPHMVWGPDFADERNLWALLRICDAVFDCPSNILWRGTMRGNNFFALHSRNDGEFREGHGPTRTAACLAALSNALGVYP